MSKKDCSVLGCNSRRWNTKMFRIPQNTIRAAEWIGFCKNPLLKMEDIKNKRYICSEHFEMKHFKGPDRTYCLLGSSKPVPTLKPPSGIWLESCCVPSCDNSCSKKYCIPSFPLDYHQEWVKRMKNDKMNELSVIEICKNFYICDKHFSSAVKTDCSKRLKPFSLPTLHLPNPAEEKLTDFFPNQVTNKTTYYLYEDEREQMRKNCKDTSSDDDDECNQYWVLVTG